MPSGIPDDGQHVVTFSETDTGSTTMTVVEHGYTLEEARDLSQAGLEQCVDKMAAIFTSA
jgi:predicted RNase H-like HicB family nuclease